MLEVKEVTVKNIDPYSYSAMKSVTVVYKYILYIYIIKPRNIIFTIYNNINLLKLLISYELKLTDLFFVEFKNDRIYLVSKYCLE